ncbi:hypothetical protein KI387_014264, partial [Taxus chinensis]
APRYFQRQGVVNDAVPDDGERGGKWRVSEHYQPQRRQGRVWCGHAGLQGEAGRHVCRVQDLRPADHVVSIHVNFINSSATKSASTATKQAATRKRMNETTSAVKIQAAFRGFCVRKTQPLKKLRVIMKTKAEAAEIRRRIVDCHFVELIRRDEECLKLTEFVMSLLLMLDAILGVNSFVRESRKAVTHELVNLQETIDDIIADKSMQARTTEAPVSSEREEESPNVNENAPVDACRESPMKKSKTSYRAFQRGRLDPIVIADREAEPFTQIYEEAFNVPGQSGGIEDEEE